MLGNDDVPPNHQEYRAGEGENELQTLTKKDFNDILAKSKEEETLKENEIKPPYPLWINLVPFPLKFKQPTF